MSETDFSKSLLHLIQFHHSTKLADTEFHEFTKLLYRYFALLISKMMMPWRHFQPIELWLQHWHQFETPNKQKLYLNLDTLRIQRIHSPMSLFGWFEIDFVPIRLNWHKILKICRWTKVWLENAASLLFETPKRTKNRFYLKFDMACRNISEKKFIGQNQTYSNGTVTSRIK